MGRRIGALLGSVAITLVATFPFVLHVTDALPAGRLSGGSQRAFWLPWQIYANVVSGRGLDDSSGFRTVRDLGLFELVGNPATALLLAPLHGLGAPVLAHNVGLLLLVLTNVLGAWALGDTLRPRPRGLLAAGLVGAAGFWSWQLGEGALAAAWVGPGLAALAAARTGRTRLFYAAALVGLIGAPLVTAVALVAGRMLLGPGPRQEPVTAAALACGLVAFLLPAAVAGGAVTLPPGVLAWPAAGSAPGLPFLFLVGIGVAWSGRLLGARGGGGLGGLGARVLAVGAVAAVLLAVGPIARDAAGEIVRVGGYQVPVAPAVPWAARSAHALLSGALVVALMAVLGLTARARFGRFGELALLALALLETRAQAALGQPVSLWSGEAWPVPRALSGLGRVPGSGAILQLPLLDLEDGLVGLVPFHRQAVSGGPGQHEPGPAREALVAAQLETAAISLLARPEEATGPTTHLVPGLSHAGYARVLVAGSAPRLRVAVQTVLGAPLWEDDLFALWDVSPQGRPFSPTDAPPPPLVGPDGAPTGTPAPPIVVPGGGLPTGAPPAGPPPAGSPASSPPSDGPPGPPPPAPGSPAAPPLAPPTGKVAPDGAPPLAPPLPDAPR